MMTIGSWPSTTRASVGLPGIVAEQLEVNARSKMIESIYNYQTEVCADESVALAHTAPLERNRSDVCLDTTGTLEIIRRLIQTTLNREIDIIMQRYLREFVYPAIRNIQSNGVQVTESNMVAWCSAALDEASQQYSVGCWTADLRHTGGCLASSPPISTSIVKKRGKRRNRIHSERKKKACVISSNNAVTATTSKFATDFQHQSASNSRRILNSSEFVLGSTLLGTLGISEVELWNRLHMLPSDVTTYNLDESDRILLGVEPTEKYMVFAAEAKRLFDARQMTEDLSTFTLPDSLLLKVRQNISTHTGQLA